MTKQLIIDSSIIIKWLNRQNEGYLKEADKIMKDAENGLIELITPELAKYEVGNVLLFGKKLSITQAKIILNNLFVLPINFFPQTFELAEETFRLASEYGLTYYDAAFASLAKQFSAVLVTDNIKHQGKVSEVKVISLKDYK